MKVFKAIFQQERILPVIAHLKIVRHFEAEVQKHCFFKHSKIYFLFLQKTISLCFLVLLHFTFDRKLNFESRETFRQREKEKDLIGIRPKYLFPFLPLLFKVRDGKTELREY